MNMLLQPNPAFCPLCGEANGCQLCSPAAYKGPCWCVAVEVPAELLALVPEHSRNRACICAGCIAKFHARKSAHVPHSASAGDFYFDADGRMVFTAAYHLRRGYCCGSNCRHCPYPKPLFATK